MRTGRKRGSMSGPMHRLAIARCRSIWWSRPDPRFQIEPERRPSGRRFFVHPVWPRSLRPLFRACNAGLQIACSSSIFVPGRALVVQGAVGVVILAAFEDRAVEVRGGLRVVKVVWPASSGVGIDCQAAAEVERSEGESRRRVLRRLVVVHRGRLHRVVAPAWNVRGTSRGGQRRATRRVVVWPASSGVGIDCQAAAEVERSEGESRRRVWHRVWSGVLPA